MEVGVVKRSPKVLFDEPALISKNLGWGGVRREATGFATCQQFSPQAVTNKIANSYTSKCFSIFQNIARSGSKRRVISPTGPFLCLATCILAIFFTPESFLTISSRQINITTSASCSIAPDSRRSESLGL